MFKAGVTRGVLIAFRQTFIRACVITGPGTNIFVIYVTNPVFFMYYPCFLWFNCDYFCELIALRLNDTEKTKHYAFFSNTQVWENHMNVQPRK